VMTPPLPPAMDPLSTACVPEAEVIDLESAECRSGATMAKSMGHSSGFHPKQQVSIRLFLYGKIKTRCLKFSSLPQGHRKISLSPQSKVCHLKLNTCMPVERD
jgi:hypothetical protein